MTDEKPRPGRLRALLTALAENRWPLYLGGLLGMAVTAYAVLIYVATRPDAPRPIAHYYEASERWDHDEALREASRRLGWNVVYDLPDGVPHVAGMPRPIDVRVVDGQGLGVRGLAGRVFAQRPADQRLNQAAAFVELPHRAGSYRALLILDQPGTWEFRLEATQGELRFVHAARLTVNRDPGPGELR